MRKNIKITSKFNKIREKLRKICQIPRLVQIDISFLFVLLFVFFVGEIRFYFWYILSLLGHELSHFFAAKKLGYFPKKIKLNFFGAVLEGDDDFLIRDEIKVVLAGPFFNFCIIIFCYLSFWFEPESYIILYDILMANWALLMFNFLPIFPLDFGRFLLLFFSLKQSRMQAIKNAKIVSYVFIFVMFLLCLISSFYTFNFSLGLSAINLMFLAFSNGKDTSYKRQLFVSRKFNLLKKGLLERTVYVENDTALYSLFKFIDDSHYFRFVFLDSNLKPSYSMGEIEFYEKIGMI